MHILQACFIDICCASRKFEWITSRTNALGTLQRKRGRVREREWMSSLSLACNGVFNSYLRPLQRHNLYFTALLVFFSCSSPFPFPVLSVAISHLHYTISPACRGNKFANGRWNIFFFFIFFSKNFQPINCSSYCVRSFVLWPTLGIGSRGWQVQ